MNQLDDNVVSAVERQPGTDFVDALLGLVFEQPIGNRLGEAAFVERRLQRQQATIAYRQTIQQIARDVQRAIDNLYTNNTLIEQTRITRLNATRSLQAFEISIQEIGGFNPQNMNLLLNRQEQLAAAERDEIRTLSDYNISLAEFSAAKGAALERNRIQFEVPSAGEVLENVRPVAQRR